MGVNNHTDLIQKGLLLQLIDTTEYGRDDQDAKSTHDLARGASMSPKLNGSVGR